MLFFILLFLNSCIPETQKQTVYRLTPDSNSFIVEIHPSPRSLKTYFRINPNESTVYEILPGNKSFPYRYRVQPKSSLSDLVRTTSIDADGFQIPGDAFLNCFGVNRTQTQSIRIIWNVPEDWQIANSYGAGESSQDIVSSCKSLSASLFVGGRNLRIHRAPFGVLALQGSFTQSDQNFSSAIDQNMRRVAEWWDEPLKPYHLAVMHAIESETSEQEGGSAHLNAFQIRIIRDRALDSRFDALVTHEYFHQWNGLQINEPVYLDRQDAIDNRWFVEGLTEYFAHQISKNDFKPDPLEPNMPLAKLKYLFNTSNQFQTFPYRQGARIALILEQWIQFYNPQNSLKTLMKEIIRRSRTDPDFTLTNPNIARALCESKLLECLDADLFIQDFIFEGRSF
ncbi:MAG: hypothetical protein I8H72_05230 [Myxococcaceae bacterium]|nr:hypothetical protein [Myxococcaceae bacterium]